MGNCSGEVRTLGCRTTSVRLQQIFHFDGLFVGERSRTYTERSIFETYAQNKMPNSACSASLLVVCKTLDNGNA